VINLNDVFCFDANVFLVLPEIDPDCECCDNLFNKLENTKTTERIIEDEVRPIHEERIAILDDMLGFYETHRGSQKFPVSRMYFGTTIDFKDDILNDIKSKDANFIQQKLRRWMRTLILQMTTRLSKVHLPYIIRTTDDVLFNTIDEIKDLDDRRHIVDVSSWVNSSPNFSLYFITLNGEDFFLNIPSLKRKLCLHYRWDIGKCKLDILHARGVSC
jgi:hypothetical protein